MRIWRHLPKFTTLFALSVVGSLCLHIGSAAALSGSQFLAGRIMDDGVFFNNQTMNPNDIQAFLSAKVPVCDTNGTQQSTHWNGSRYYTRAEWGTINGYPPPYTCLKSYAETISGKAADTYCPGSVAGGTKTSATLLYEVSQACGVNPKVLIVLLQKEQSLVTDDWPWSIQYRSATGYGCPDTSACDSQYYGFFNQIWNAARQFHRYAQQANLFNFRASQNSFVQYNPNSGCGGSNVFISNQATAGLYNYTPYQPNAAALNNLYGTGDGCSAYGNRNFWRLYNDWFGSTLNAVYTWQYVNQAVYTDSTKSTPVDSYNQALVPNTRYYFTLTVQNTGNATWTQSSVHLATNRPADRASQLYDSTWLGPSRPAGLVESSVAPGEVGHFEFWVKSPNGWLPSQEYFTLVAEGITWMNDVGLNWIMNAPVYTWRYEGQASYTDSNKTTAVDTYTKALSPNTRYYFTLAARNTGNVAWKQGTVRLATAWPADRGSQIYDSTWVGPSRPANLVEASVAPGEVGHFEFWVKAPNGWLPSREYFTPVAEGITWMNDVGLNWIMNQPAFQWQYEGQAMYTSSNKTTPVSSLSVNTRYYFTLAARNIGNVTWQQNTVRLGTNRPGDRSSQLYDSTWLGSSRPAALLESSVAPGAIGHFEFWVTTPASPIDTKEYFNPLAEGLVWMNDPGMHWVITTH